MIAPLVCCICGCSIHLGEQLLGLTLFIFCSQFKELSEAIGDVVFIKVDVDAHPDTAAKYNVSAMPTFVFLKAGEVIDRLMGANAARLQELISEHK